MAIEYGTLTGTDVNRIGYPAHWTCLYASEDGVLVSFYLFTHDFRGKNCDSCTFNCHTGSTPWTIPERRGEGIFKGLWEWGRNTYGWDKTYSSGDYPPEALPIYWKYGISDSIATGRLIPENYLDRTPTVIALQDRIKVVTGLS